MFVGYVDVMEDVGGMRDNKRARFKEIQFYASNNAELYTLSKVNVNLLCCINKSDRVQFPDNWVLWTTKARWLLEIHFLMLRQDNFIRIRKEIWCMQLVVK